MASDFYGSVGAAANSAAAAAATSSRWLTEEVFKLIDMVQRDEAIYNPRHKYYFCRPYVENFWREVDLKLEKNPGASLAKWTNLRISFRREYTNYLEEKVPPCWSYFDRMFFLHPYLRKKHQQPKSLDSQVQDALAQISSLSNRLQRERVVAAAANAAVSMAANCARSAHTQQAAQSQPVALDNYLEYFDDPEQNNSELDEIIDEEQQSRFQHLETHSLNNDIKSECDEHVDDYDAEPRHDDDEPVDTVAEEADVEADADDTEMHSFLLDTLATSTAQEKRYAHQQQNQQHHQFQHVQLQRMQHLSRLQTRSYHEDLRAKRPRSQESISSTQQSGGSVVGTSVSAAHTTQQRLLSASTPNHTNVSFVRPTFAKPVDVVSTTTSSAGAANHNNSNNVHDGELSSSSVVATAATTVSAVATTTNSALQQPTAVTYHHHHSQRHLPHHHHHRLEIAGISGGNSTAAAAAAANTSSASALSQVAPHVELCDCKTDPDAMFLMSLLPDIQKLNGRDRGKIKIAFQNILQDYLYPD